MERFSSLCQPQQSCGYTRGALRQDVLYNSFRFRDVHFAVSKKQMAATRAIDSFTQELLQRRFIRQEEAAVYHKALLEALSRIDQLDALSCEALYHHIHSIRLSVLGADPIEKLQMALAQEAVPFCPNGIDQSNLKAALLKDCDTVLFAITDARLSQQLLSDISATKGKNQVLLCGSTGENLLSEGVLRSFVNASVTFATALPRLPENCCLLVYGEEGFTACRSLCVDAIVHSTAVGYCAQAVTGLWAHQRCLVYVPRGMDITAHVPLTQKTRLTYSHLSRLAADFGAQIYTLSAEDLYRRYPRYFWNVYHLAPTGLPLEAGFSEDEAVFSQFDRQLDQGLQGYLGSFPGVEFHSAYFDENLSRQPICYQPEQKQPGILVQAVKVRRSENAAILRCEKGVTPRQKLASVKGVGIVSNFLFFLTSKLGVLYNDLRADRPMEQADAAAGHLDYMLEHRSGKRIETFPLFRKTGIAMTADGQFLFFNFRLGGGQVTISGQTYRWEASQVDSDTAPLRLYTPYYSLTDRDAPRDSYRREVGHGRVNVVILQDRITCIRKGDVLLPSVGVVLSLSQEAAAPLLSKCAPLADGYYDVSALDLTVHLDAPTDVDAAQWESVQWAYGGGLTLIRDGMGLCDGEHMQSWFDTEGWSSPLSRQTQESNLHSLVKHPRTAIGCTEKGELVVLVYSGRTWRSTGADYREMIAIARQLFPDVRYLMNCDGGGSAMLGMVQSGEFLELSTPSTSAGSCAGQVRPINTLFYIPLQSN